MATTIFGLKSLTLSQFVHLKQGLHGLNVYICMLWVPFHEKEGIAVLQVRKLAHIIFSLIQFALFFIAMCHFGFT